MPPGSIHDFVSISLFKYTGSISENQMGVVVVKMEVRDEDQIHTPCWRSRFRIIQGDSDHLFSISTGPSGDQGILATAKVLLRMYKTQCSQD